MHNVVHYRGKLQSPCCITLELYMRPSGVLKAVLSSTDPNSIPWRLWKIRMGFKGVDVPRGCQLLFYICVGVIGPGARFLNSIGYALMRSKIS